MRQGALISAMLVALAVALPAAAAASVPQGPLSISNDSIAERAERFRDLSRGGQCLVFVAEAIQAAGGPRHYFGYDTSRYQSKWKQWATEVKSLPAARRGDIIQWGGGIGGTLDPHTAIITTAGKSPRVIDSNFSNARDERVRRGSFSSRNRQGARYKIWRVGRVSTETSNDPRGRFEGVSSPAVGRVRVRGWTFDPDSPKAANSVHVYVGGKNHKSVTAKGNRSDVARVHKAAGPNHGFDVTVPTKLKGKQKVCVYGINLSKTGGKNALLGCKMVTVKASTPVAPPSTSPPNPGSAPAPPKGHFDTVSSPAVGKIRVRGWSFDPNAPADPVAVHVYVGGKNHKIVTANLKRDDVADAYEGAENPGPNHGFDVTFSTALKGSQEVCVYAIDIGSGPNPKLGCKKVTVTAPAPPPPPRTVTLAKGGSAQGLPGCKSSYCRYMTVSFKNFSSGSHSITCRASNGSEGGFFTYTRSGSSGSSAVCYYGFPGHKVWVTVDGVSSNNKITW